MGKEEVKHLQSSEKTIGSNSNLNSDRRSKGFRLKRDSTSQSSISKFFASASKSVIDVSTCDKDQGLIENNCDKTTDNSTDNSTGDEDSEEGERQVPLSPSDVVV